MLNRTEYQVVDTKRDSINGGTVLYTTGSKRDAFSERVAQIKFNVDQDMGDYHPRVCQRTLRSLRKDYWDARLCVVMVTSRVIR